MEAERLGRAQKQESNRIAAEQEAIRKEIENAARKDALRQEEDERIVAQAFRNGNANRNSELTAVNVALKGLPNSRKHKSKMQRKTRKYRKN